MAAPARTEDWILTEGTLPLSAVQVQLGVPGFVLNGRAPSVKGPVSVPGPTLTEGPFR